MTFKSDKQRKGFFAMKGIKGSNVNKFNTKIKPIKKESKSIKVTVVTDPNDKNEVVAIVNGNITRAKKLMNEGIEDDFEKGFIEEYNYETRKTE